MLLFKSAPLVDERQQWLIIFLWAVEHFDSEYFLAHANHLPNGQFFPDRVSSVGEMAERYLVELTIMPGMRA